MEDNRAVTAQWVNGGEMGTGCRGRRGERAFRVEGTLRRQAAYSGYLTRSPAGTLGTDPLLLCHPVLGSWATGEHE